MSAGAGTLATEPTGLLYVGGFTRSGSTLLSYLLGALPGLHPVGELRELWTKGVLNDNLCSCGQRFSDCPFWTVVGERAFGGWHNLDAAELAATSEALATDTRLIPLLLSGWRGPARLARLREHTVTVYRTVAELTGASVVVDSSKIAAFALLVAGEATIRPRVVHLVRDSRGVAFSWGKRDVAKPDAATRGHAEGQAVMDTYGVGATALRWSYHNAVFHLLRARRVPVTRLLYEQLVVDAPGQIENALTRLGMDAGVSLSDAHTIGGNPMRFRGREQPLRLDDQWRSAMSARARREVTLLTWPLLRSYGYPVRWRRG